MRKALAVSLLVVATLSQPLAGVSGARPFGSSSPVSVTPQADVPQPGSGLDWCAHTMGGPGGSSAVPVDFSNAHNLVREFSVTSRYTVGDQALSSALNATDPFGSRLASVLAKYDRALSDVCVLPAGPGSLGSVSVTTTNGVAIVKPGTG